MRLQLLFLFLSLFPVTVLAHEPDSPTFRFIENKNQWDSRILYQSEIPSGTLFLEKNCFTYNLVDGKLVSSLHGHQAKQQAQSIQIPSHAFKMNFQNSNQDVVVDAEGSFSDYYNYFLGNSSAKWASKVKAFKIVHYQNLYEGIDLKVYSQNNHLKYDFIILPNVDPSLIKVNYQGLDDIGLTEGNLILKTSLGTIVEQRPYAYQTINGKVVPVKCYYVLQGNTVSYAFPNGYNKSQKLVIDPTLIFSTYSGSIADNFGYSATFDSEGFLYSASSVFFFDGYPTTIGAYQTTFAGGYVDMGISKYDTSGTKRIYSTYIGGVRTELPHSLIVDNNDELLIFGTTSSPNYPFTTGAYDSTFAAGDSTINMINGIGVLYTNGSDMFISKLSKDGSSLVASTLLGGSSNDGLLALSTFPRASNLRYNYADEVRGEIEIDKDNNVYIVSCTKSADFPIVGTSTTFSGGMFDAVVVKMNNNLTSILWSTFLGGNKDDALYSIEIDTLNNIYVSGGTTSTNLPTTAGVLYPSQNGGRADGFIVYLSSSGTQIYTTYYGSGAYDQIYFIDLDIFNNVYVFGQTSFTGAANPFIHNAVFNQPNSGQFISKMTPELDSLIWSTVFGNGSGQPNISPTAFLVDLCSKIYLSGWGGSPEFNDFISFSITRPFNMLTTLGFNPPADFYQSTTTGHDFYLLVLEDDASSVHYASFFGGSQSKEHVDGGTSRFDKKGKMYQAMCAGCGGNSDMPIKPAFGSTELPETNNSGQCNLGVFKMDFRLPAVVADFDAQGACPGDPIQFINKSLMKSATTFEWSFGDGTPFSYDTNAVHAYAVGGIYNVRLVVRDNATCNLADTIIKQVYVSTINNLPIAATADQYTIYKGKSTVLHAIPNPGYLYTWTPSGSLSSATNPNPRAKPDTTTTYTVFIADPLLPACRRSANVTINVVEVICEEPRIFIPNAFTPNGDGDNDVLYVRSNYEIEMFFTVYDRWGEKVFETQDKNVGWDGVYKGMKADPGVFVYYLEVTCPDDQKFFKKGNVTLIR